MDRYREHIRLPGFDYRENHAYFVTVCTGSRSCIFGAVAEGKVQLTQRGIVVEQCWKDVPNHHPFVELDEMVVMPNHFHATIFFVGNDVAATPASPIRSPAHGPLSRSLSAVIGSFKSAVTRTVNQMRPGTGQGLWQPNFYEHIIRTDRGLNLIRDYITNNPGQWAQDEHNPAAQSPVPFDRWLAARGMGDAGVAATEATLP